MVRLVAYDEDLADRLRLLLDAQHLTEKKMFGGLAFCSTGTWPSP